MLLPLSTGKVRALSLENHLAFATVRTERGNSGQIINLLRVVYLAFYLREETASGAEPDLYRQAEAVLEACVERAEQGGRWLLLDHEQTAVERLLVVHDEQLASVPKYRYLAAWDRLPTIRYEHRALANSSRGARGRLTGGEVVRAALLASGLGRSPRICINMD